MKYSAAEVQKFVEDLYKNADETLKELFKHQYKGKKQIEEEVMNLIFTYVVQNDMMDMSRQDQKKEIRKLDKFIDAFYKADAQKQIALLYKLLENTTDTVFKFYEYNADKKEVKKIVEQSYRGRHFSERVWENETQVAKYMKKQLFDFIQGKVNVNQVTKKISDLFGNSHYESRRLAETEVARCQSAAFDRFGSEVGVKKVKYRATLCNTCNKCKADDGKPFDFDNKIELPRHPHCQCYYDIVESYETNNKINWKDPKSDESDMFNKIKSIFPSKTKTKIREFEKGLSNCDNEQFKMLLEESKNRVSFKMWDKNNSRYDKDSKTVMLGKNADHSTIAHELFHEIDRKYKISDNNMITKQIQNDYEKIQNMSIYYGKTIEEMIYLKYPNAFTQTKRGFKINVEYRGISDIINGMTYGEVKLGYGHKDNYWDNPDNLKRETWAQFGRILYSNDKDVIEMTRFLLKDTFKEVLNIIERLD